MSQLFTHKDRAFLDGLTGDKELARKYLHSTSLWQSFTNGLQQYYIRKYEITGGNRN